MSLPRVWHLYRTSAWHVRESDRVGIFLWEGGYRGPSDRYRRLKRSRKERG